MFLCPWDYLFGFGEKCDLTGILQVDVHLVVKHFDFAGDYLFDQIHYAQSGEQFINSVNSACEDSE